MDGEALTEPLLSILVDSWNADDEVVDKLRRLLGALERQTLPFGQLEVVVAVDEEAAPAIAELATDYQNVVVVPLRPTGVFAMNNAALRRARGRHIAYLHSDIVPSPVWAERL